MPSPRHKIPHHVVRHGGATIARNREGVTKRFRACAREGLPRTTGDAPTLHRKSAVVPRHQSANQLPAVRSKFRPRGNLRPVDKRIGEEVYRLFNTAPSPRRVVPDNLKITCKALQRRLRQIINTRTTATADMPHMRRLATSHRKFFRIFRLSLIHLAPPFLFNG